MVMVSLGNIDGEAVSYSTGELHADRDLNRDRKYHVYRGLLHTDPNPNGDKNPVTIFILDYETLVIDPKIRLITGDHILGSIGYIREEKALIKEDYLLNLSEFKKYISDDAALRDSGLDVIESGLVSQQEAFQINGRSTELGLQVISEVTAGINPCLEDGYLSAVGLSPWKIDVQIVYQKMLRLKLIVMEVKRVSITHDALRRKYWRFIDFTLLRDHKNVQDVVSTSMEDLHTVLENHENLPQYAPYAQEDWTRQINKQRELFQFKVTTILNRKAMRAAVKTVRFLDDLNEINIELFGESFFDEEGTVECQFLNLINMISIGGGNRNWLNRIREHSPAVASLNVDGVYYRKYNEYE